MNLKGRKGSKAIAALLLFSISQIGLQIGLAEPRATESESVGVVQQIVARLVTETREAIAGVAARTSARATRPGTAGRPQRPGGQRRRGARDSDRRPRLTSSVGTRVPRRPPTASSPSSAPAWTTPGTGRHRRRHAACADRVRTAQADRPLDPVGARAFPRRSPGPASCVCGGAGPPEPGPPRVSSNQAPRLAGLDARQRVSVGPYPAGTTSVGVLVGCHRAAPGQARDTFDARTERRRSCDHARGRCTMGA